MNRTILLAKLLGINPPYTVNYKLLDSLDKVEVYQLYLHAKLNKLEYLFLKSLEFAGAIERYRLLKNRLILCENIFNKFTKSILDIKDTLLKMGVKHVFVKTIYEIPVLPGDIDILINEKLSTNLIDILVNNKFVPFDKGPHFVSVYNINVDSKIPRKKKPYDIDVYDEISLNYLVYLDKKLFINEIEYKNIKERSSESKNNDVNDNIIVHVLSPEHELVVDINHALFEQLFTLLHFYIILSSIRHVEVDKLIEIMLKTKSSKVMRYSMNIVLCILENAFTEELNRSELSRVNDVAKVVKLKSCNLEPNIELPYRFTLAQVASVMAEKSTMYKFMKGLLLLVLNTLNPRMGSHIVYHIALRRERATY